MSKLLNFSTIEEANAFFKNYNEKRNSSGIKEFFGLSPIQMQVILYQPLKLGRFICIEKGESTDFSEVQIVQQAYFFLNKISDAQEIKLTDKGNLPRILVKEFWHRFFTNDRYIFEPHREEDCMELTRLHYLLKYSGLIQKRKKVISLSKKGEKILREKDDRSLYTFLFESFFNDWNWSYMDRYSENQIIQMAGLFGLFLLSQLATDWVTVQQMGEAFIRAFPASLNEVDFFFESREKSFIRCFSTRFLDRTCESLGLIEWEEKESPFANLEDRFRITKLFSQCIRIDTNF